LSVIVAPCALTTLNVPCNEISAVVPNNFLNFAGV
jgi:hypothetical protein